MIRWLLNFLFPTIRRDNERAEMWRQCLLEEAERLAEDLEEGESLPKYLDPDSIRKMSHVELGVAWAMHLENEGKRR